MEEFMCKKCVRLDSGVCVDCGLTSDCILVSDEFFVYIPYVRYSVNSVSLQLNRALGSLISEKDLLNITLTYDRITKKNIMKTRNRFVYLYISIRISLGYDPRICYNLTASVQPCTPFPT